MFLLPFIAAPGLYIFYMFFLRDKRNHIVDSLYLTKYDIDRKNPTQIVHLTGRKSGFIGWVLKFLNAAMTYDITISVRDIKIASSGIFNEGQTFLPMSQIITTTWGYKRPRFALFFALAFGFFGLMVLPGIAPVYRNNLGELVSTGSLLTSIIFFVIGGLIFWFGYWRQRTVEISFSTGDGLFWGYNYILGTGQNLEKARETTLILNELIQRVHRGDEAMMFNDYESDKADTLDEELAS
ncbi:hypothetical protein G4Y79_02455 [Phototrophicus methaneseepsis]|uniref:Uncharacterized protein n=1 Tax=Phototrophicus methaneseepsis TaxID=2710758 RepID=A0A7S8EAI6_9CHLR|nr:hypothetical protein [Phototrophicus methaneseepsis]QPC83258.1 hypothetical protein G4Y79_02455 [Phototrophicus methaneseepsis]